jgi:hypothetical protein
MRRVEGMRSLSNFHFLNSPRLNPTINGEVASPSINRYIKVTTEVDHCRSLIFPILAKKALFLSHLIRTKKALVLKNSSRSCKRIKEFDIVLFCSARA